LDTASPFTAARARNAGFRRLRETCPHLAFVQFVDGDCELNASWIEDAASFLESHLDVGAVSGRQRERYPENSIYNWLCDEEWNKPIGEAQDCSGNIMIRVSAFEAVAGYRDDLVAAEDYELCVRLRAAGWRILRLDREMALHDAAIQSFGQWWLRMVRGGYAFSLGAHLHGAAPHYLFLSESRRAWLLGTCLPLVCLMIGLLLSPWGWIVWLIYPAWMLQKFLFSPEPLRRRLRLTALYVLLHFAHGLGQIRFLLDRLLGRQPRLIEYK
jgi:GT2 family glycosyltransferase